MRDGWPLDDAMPECLLFFSLPRPILRRPRLSVAGFGDPERIGAIRARRRMRNGLRWLQALACPRSTGATLYGRSRGETLGSAGFYSPVRQPHAVCHPTFGDVGAVLGLE